MRKIVKLRRSCCVVGATWKMPTPKPRGLTALFLLAYKSCGEPDLNARDAVLHWSPVSDSDSDLIYNTPSPWFIHWFIQQFIYLLIRLSTCPFIQLHLFIQSCIHLVIFSFSYLSIIHFLIHSVIPIHSIIRSFIQLSVHSFNYPFIHSIIRSFIQLSVHSNIYSFNYPIISVIHSFNYLFIHSINSFTHLLLCTGAEAKT